MVRLVFAFAVGGWHPGICRGWVSSATTVLCETLSSEAFASNISRKQTTTDKQNINDTLGLSLNPKPLCPVQDSSCAAQKLASNSVCHSTEGQCSRT